MSEAIVCDICGRKLSERCPPDNFPAGDRGLHFTGAPEDDVCESCQRAMWVALGKERGWRMTRERPAKAPSVPAEAPPAPEPPGVVADPIPPEGPADPIPPEGPTDAARTQKQDALKPKSGGWQRRVYAGGGKT